jgi:hypothetical protein
LPNASIGPEATDKASRERVYEDSKQQIPILSKKLRRGIRRKLNVKPTYSYKQRPSSYWRNKLLETKTLTCSGNKAGRKGTSLLLAPYHEMVQTSQQALAVCCERMDVRPFIPFFVEKETKHICRKTDRKKKLYFIQNVYEVIYQQKGN